jgi:hypothetical protein
MLRTISGQALGDADNDADNDAADTDATDAADKSNRLEFYMFSFHFPQILQFVFYLLFNTIARYR